MTAAATSTAFPAIPPRAIRQGDLLLVTRIPGEPLGRLMEALDGTRFSHSGIATRVTGDDRTLPATHLASALATELESGEAGGAGGLDGLDLGGVRWDPFAQLWAKHRDLYCIPMPDDLRRRALDHLAAFRPEPGREGTFSIVKLVAVAVALRSIELTPQRPDRAEALFAAARDVATAWAASPDEPSYYCAELAADAYGRAFTRAEMVPPPSDGIGDDVDEPWWVVRLAELLSDRFDGIDDPRGRAWTHLSSALAGQDWDFLAHALGASARAAVFALRGDVEGPVATPEPLRAPQAGHPGLAFTDVAIPHALVTPRMLWSVFGRDAHGRDTIRRVERPS